MDYQKLFEKVSHHLSDLGIAWEFEVGELATDKMISKAEQKMDLQIPAELREFYHHVGDGLSLGWNCNVSDRGPFASLVIPSLEELVNNRASWRSIWLYTPEKAQKSGFNRATTTQKIRCVDVETGPSLLIRLDACVAWSSGGNSIDGLEQALRQWFMPTRSDKRFPT